MNHRIFYIINGITMYRLLMAPVILILALFGHFQFVKWLVPVSFFSDLADGFLARKYEAASLLGSRLDSLADDLTIVASVVALFIFEPGFFRLHVVVLVVLVALWIMQNLMAFLRYRRLSSFHTYSAKCAAFLQGLFIILFFQLSRPVYPLFYVMIGATVADLIEEILLVTLLPLWKANVKGFYWQWKALQR